MRKLDSLWFGNAFQPFKKEFILILKLQSIKKRKLAVFFPEILKNLFVNIFAVSKNFFMRQMNSPYNI